MGMEFRQLLWVCNYAVAQSILYIQCFANCVSKEAFSSLCQAPKKLVARLIVTKEGLYLTALHFLVLGIAASSLWSLPCCSQLCLGEESGLISVLLKASVIYSTKQKHISAHRTGSQESRLHVQWKVGYLALSPLFHLLRTTGLCF